MLPPIPDHLIWYAIAWAFLMSPFYFLGIVMFVFMTDVRRFMLWYMENPPEQHYYWTASVPRKKDQHGEVINNVSFSHGFPEKEEDKK